MCVPAPDKVAALSIIEGKTMPKFRPTYGSSRGLGRQIRRAKCRPAGHRHPQLHVNFGPGARWGPFLFQPKLLVVHLPAHPPKLNGRRADYLTILQQLCIPLRMLLKINSHERVECGLPQTKRLNAFTAGVGRTQHHLIPVRSQN